jgi:single-strand DNA-binding protein
MTAQPNIIPIVGNLTSDPELRTTQSGISVVNFSVASTPRVSDGAGGFKDGDTVFWRCTAWRTLAENVSVSFKKGSRVLLVGEAKPDSYEKDGVIVTTLSIDVKEIGASVEFATVTIAKNAPRGQQAPAQVVAAVAPVAAAVAAPVLVAAAVAPVAAPVAAPALVGASDFDVDFS